MDPAAFPSLSDDDLGLETVHRASALPDGLDVAEPTGDAIRRILSDDFRRRLQRTEHEVSVMTQMEREAVADWLGGMLHRPPLERPTAAFAPMRALVEALWWDIADRTPADVTDPDAGNPRLDAAHPWGEGPDQ